MGLALLMGPEEVAGDRERIHFSDNGQDWIIEWHPPDSAAQQAPAGTRHGSSAVCVTPDGEVVLISANGESWDLPGGRPEGDEDWRETLDREVLEEACARVVEATLLGYTKGECLSGPEKGLILVRSVWYAAVTLDDWDPRHEISHRRLVPFDAALDEVPTNPGLRTIYARIFQEALGVSANQHPEVR